MQAPPLQRVFLGQTTQRWPLTPHSELLVPAAHELPVVPEQQPQQGAPLEPQARQPFAAAGFAPNPSDTSSAPATAPPIFFSASRREPPAATVRAI